MTEGQKSNYSPDGHIESHRQKLAIEDTPNKSEPRPRQEVQSEKIYQDDLGSPRRRQSTVYSCSYLTQIRGGAGRRGKSLWISFLASCNDEKGRTEATK